MKDFLLEKYNEYNNKYSELKVWLNDNAVDELWGMGIMPAYSIEPYSTELLGSSPGKMLRKKQSIPAKNRQKYFLDSSHNIIGELRYAQFIEEKKEWIIYRNFYLRNDKQIIGLVFCSALESSNDTTLNQVILVKLEENKVTNSYSYSFDKRFSERKYLYNNGNISDIEEKLWLNNIYIEHFYTIDSIDPLHIIEKAQSEIIQIYPL